MFWTSGRIRLAKALRVFARVEQELLQAQSALAAEHERLQKRIGELRVRDAQVLADGELAGRVAGRMAELIK